MLGEVGVGQRTVGFLVPRGPFADRLLDATRCMCGARYRCTWVRVWL